MAKKKLEDELIEKKARQLRDDLDKMIAKEEAFGDWGKEELVVLDWDDAVVETPVKPPVTQKMMDEFVKDSQAERMAREEAERLKWLDDTQNMRVVALNEACGLMKCMMENVDNLTIDPRLVTGWAKAFADFLVEGRS